MIIPSNHICLDKLDVIGYFWFGLNSIHIDYLLPFSIGFETLVTPCDDGYIRGPRFKYVVNGWARPLKSAGFCIKSMLSINVSESFSFVE